MAVDKNTRAEVVAAGRRRLKRPPARVPVILPNGQVRRIRERKPRLLILGRSLDVGMYEVHNAQIVQRNRQHQLEGRSDLQADPVALMIEVNAGVDLPIGELDATQLLAGGYRDFEEFFGEWLERRRRFHPTTLVHVYEYQIVSPPRYLHQRVHRGYTHDPREAVPDEPEAVDRDTLDRFAVDGHARFEESHVDLLQQQHARSIAIRIKEAERLGGDAGADMLRRARSELERLEASMRAGGSKAA